VAPRRESRSDSGDSPKNPFLDVTWETRRLEAKPVDKAGGFDRPDRYANPNTLATFISQGKQARSDTGRADLESLFGLNPGKLDRASHRPSRRDRPFG
jgi:hypothetical protein